MSIIAWVVLGLLAGAMLSLPEACLRHAARSLLPRSGTPTAGYTYAKAISPSYQGGEILSTMILGIIGAFIGGSLFTLLQIKNSANYCGWRWFNSSWYFSGCARRNSCYLSIGINQKRQQCLIAD